MDTGMRIARQSTVVKAKIFRGFADPSRLSILEVLRSGSLTVNELVHMTHLSQTNVSNHLRRLYECGLVDREPVGRQVRYALGTATAERLMQICDELLDEVGARIEACANYACADADSVVGGRA